MAKKQNTSAARERKQKIVIGVGFAVLAVLMVLQGPKLLKAFGGGSDSTAAPSAAATPQAGTSAGTPAATGTTAVTATPTFAVRAPRNARTQLAGVVIVPEQPVKAGDGQLGSFSRFESKDPFVQQVHDAPLPTPAEVGGFANRAKNTATAVQQRGAPATSGGAAGVANAPGVAYSPGAAPAVKPTIAVLNVNGKMLTVALSKRFPQSDRAFVLRKLKPGQATIAIADGSFVGGGTLVLRVGRAATLVNTATGARYVVELLFVGDKSPQVTRFTAK